MPRPETGDASRDTRLQAARRAVVEGGALLDARREGLLGDALAALHADALGAPSLEALRPLAEDWGLRAALFEVISRAKEAPYVRRAATELAVAFEAVSPWARRPRQRAADALLRASEHLDAAPAESALVASLGVLLAATAGASVWARGALEGLLGWAAVPLAGLLAFAALAWNGSGRGRKRSAIQRGMANAARAAGAAWAVGSIALAARASLADPGGPGVGLLIALAPLVLCLAPAISTLALASALRRAAAFASQPLRRLSRRVVGATPRVPQVAAWRFDEVKVGRAEAARVVDAQRQSQRAHDARLREMEAALRGDEGGATPEVEDARGPYRRGEAAAGGGVGAREVDALEARFGGRTAKARRLRERYLAHLAHEAAAAEDDGAAARLVEDGAARFERAGAAMTPEERRGVARVAAWSRGGIRRLQRLAGEAMVTDDAPPPPTGVRVAPDAAEPAGEPDEDAAEGRVTGSTRRPASSRWSGRSS